jgi:hypothetical protein
VYDLVNAREVTARQEKDRLLVDVDLGPCDGRLYMVAPKAIDRVHIQAPATIQRGARASCQIEVLDAEGKPIEAIVPLKVAIRDSESRAAEFSGYYAAVDGKVEIPLDIASNDPLGYWQIEVRDLASGRAAMQGFRVPGPDPWPPVQKPASETVPNPVQPKG